MELKNRPHCEISQDLLDAVRTLPVRREIEHCGTRFSVSPFDFYAECPGCGSRLKVRSYSGVLELEDVFDAFFEWLNQPGAQEVARRRQEIIAEDAED